MVDAPLHSEQTRAMNPSLKRVTALWFGLLTLACGETRTLDLFEKKPRPPAKAPGTCEGTTCPPTPPTCMEEACSGCSASVVCSPDRPACMDAQCVECTTDEHCPMKKVCNTVALRCTEPCSAPEACKDKARAWCDSMRGLCVECLEDAHCPAQHTCDVVQGICMACTRDSDCGDAGTCDPMRHVCIPS